MQKTIVSLFLGAQEGGVIGGGWRCGCTGGGCGNKAVKAWLDFHVLVRGGSGELLRSGVSVGDRWRKVIGLAVDMFHDAVWGIVGCDAVDNDVVLLCREHGAKNIWLSRGCRVFAF